MYSVSVLTTDKTDKLRHRLKRPQCRTRT